MLEGITVLSETSYTMHWWQALIIALLLAIVCGLIFTVMYDWRSGVFVGVIVLFCVCGLIYFGNRESSTTYKVLIDDTVSMKEFDELYEIVGHDGDIVIIKMKE